MTAENEAILNPPPQYSAVSDTLQVENRRLRDQVSALAAENRALTAHVAELEMRLAAAAPQKVEERSPAPAQARPPVTPAPATGKSADKQAAYDAALQSYRSHDFKGAIKQFEDLLNNSIGPDLADNCHYWIGESYYAQKKYDLAAQEFQSVIEFPSSDKEKDAMLMLGNSLAALGKKEEARKVLDALIKANPGTNVAKRAQAKLDQLK
jgi:tol-pal system protein YbgF